jgi:5-oxoprolinase (ATP-hydrolysing)
VGELARSLGFTQVSLSSELMPMVKIVPRGITASVDAYLTPGIQQYIRGFYSGFDENLSKASTKHEKAFSFF